MAIGKDAALQGAHKLDACACAFRANPDAPDLRHLRYSLTCAPHKGLRTNHTRNTMNVLGIQLNAPSLMGLLRMLGFTLCAIALVEIADSLNSGVWANEGSLSFIVGGFSGFLLNESGADFAKHGWRAFALLMACAIFVFAAFSLAF
jgi:hypothetical protein